MIVCKDDVFFVLRTTKFINEKFGKCTRMHTRSRWNEMSLIVTTINPIWHSHPVHPGTKFTICSLKSKENIIFAHNFILEKHKQTKQLVVLIFNRAYFSSKED